MAKCNELVGKCNSVGHFCATNTEYKKKKNRLQADGGYGSSATGVKMKKK